MGDEKELTIDLSEVFAGKSEREMIAVIVGMFSQFSQQLSAMNEIKDGAVVN